MTEADPKRIAGYHCPSFAEREKTLALRAKTLVSWKDETGLNPPKLQSGRIIPVYCITEVSSCPCWI